MPNFATGHVVTAAEYNAICPVGVVLPFAGSSVPTDWLVCNGSAVSRITYSDLFTAVGTTYGVGDGSTTFNVPDMQGRIPVGKGTHADVSSLGNNDGTSLANRRPKHRHTVTDSGHNHGVTDPGHGHGVTDPGHTHSDANDFISGSSIVRGSGSGDGPGAGTTGSSTTGVTVNNNTTGVGVNSNTTGISIGGGSDPLDAAAYLVLNYIIKT